jgi:hypothetical protein
MHDSADVSAFLASNARQNAKSPSRELRATRVTEIVPARRRDLDGFDERQPSERLSHEIYLDQNELVSFYDNWVELRRRIFSKP